MAIRAASRGSPAPPRTARRSIRTSLTASDLDVVRVRVSARRPDGRSPDDAQVVTLAVDSGHVRTVDQYVGDPAAVRAFWA
jgi:hypothetical protein